MSNGKERVRAGQYPLEYIIGLANEFHAPILVAPCNLIGQYNSGFDSAGRKTGIRQLYDDAGITPPPFGHISRVVVQIRGEDKIGGKTREHFSRREIGEYTEAEIAEIKSKAGNNNITVANDTAGYICSSCFHTGNILENKRASRYRAKTKAFFDNTRR